MTEKLSNQFCRKVQKRQLRLQLNQERRRVQQTRRWNTGPFNKKAFSYTFSGSDSEKGSKWESHLSIGVVPDRSMTIFESHGYQLPLLYFSMLSMLVTLLKELNVFGKASCHMSLFLKSKDCSGRNSMEKKRVFECFASHQAITFTSQKRFHAGRSAQVVVTAEIQPGYVSEYLWAVCYHVKNSTTNGCLWLWQESWTRFLY